MKSLLRLIGKLLDYVEEGIVVIGLAVMAALNFANVVSRYFLHSSISWTEEIILIIFLWVTMFGIAVGYKRNIHLGMSFVTDHFPPKGKKIAAVFSGVCSVILIYFIIRYGIVMVQNQIRFHAKTTVLRLPTAVQGSAIVVGGFFMLIRSVQCTVQEVIRLGGEKQ